jgi:hypothetical protein
MSIWPHVGVAISPNMRLLGVVDNYRNISLLLSVKLNPMSLGQL